MSQPAFERFVADHYHELFGLICEAATAGRKGGELSLWMTGAGRTIKSRLLAIYNDLTPKEEKAPRPDVPVQGPHRKPDGKVSV